jgi:hypothetical protein
MRCPVCRLESPENTRRCDCGHEFAAAYAASAPSTRIGPIVAPDPSASLYLRSIDRNVRTIKFVVVAWAVLTVIGFVAWLLAVALRAAG